MKPGANEVSCNPSSSPTFEEILSLSRRQLVQGGLGALAFAMVTGPRELLAQWGDPPSWASRAFP